jgi:hypothetical protein
MNIFQNLHKNQIFLLIILVTILVQVIIVELGSDFVRTTSLSVSQWIKCILLGSLSLPLGGLMRLIPVQDSDTDFAVLPSILVQKSHEAKMKLMENKNFLTEEQKSEYRRSFQVWLFVVMISPLLTYYAFEEQWAPHVKSFGDAIWVMMNKK